MTVLLTLPGRFRAREFVFFTAIVLGLVLAFLGFENVFGFTHQLPSGPNARFLHPCLYIGDVGYLDRFSSRVNRSHWANSEVLGAARIRVEGPAVRKVTGSLASASLKNHFSIIGGRHKSHFRQRNGLPRNA